MDKVELVKFLESEIKDIREDLDKTDLRLHGYKILQHDLDYKIAHLEKIKEEDRKARAERVDKFLYNLIDKPKSIVVKVINRILGK